MPSEPSSSMARRFASPLPIPASCAGTMTLSNTVRSSSRLKNWKIMPIEARRRADATEYGPRVEELLQRLSRSKHMTWLTDQAVVLATTCLYALMLPLTMPSPDDGLFRFPDLGAYQTIGLCVVLALPIL